MKLKYTSSSVAAYLYILLRFPWLVLAFLKPGFEMVGYTYFLVVCPSASHLLFISVHFIICGQRTIKHCCCKNLREFITSLNCCPKYYSFWVSATCGQVVSCPQMSYNLYFSKKFTSGYNEEWLEFYCMFTGWPFMPGTLPPCELLLMSSLLYKLSFQNVIT